MTLWAELRAVRREEGDPAATASERESRGAAAETERGGGEGQRDQEGLPPRGARERRVGQAASLPDPPSLPPLPHPHSPHRFGQSAGGAARVAEGTSLAANQSEGLTGPLAASLNEGERVGVRGNHPQRPALLKVQLGGQREEGVLSAGGQQTPKPPAPVNGFKGSSALLKGSAPRAHTVAEREGWLLKVKFGFLWRTLNTGS